LRIFKEEQKDPDIASIHQLRLIFTQLDSLRDILAKTLEGWQPPQLVVIGQESSGKSTVLERLAMMPIFPRDDNICTRLPIHVRLRNADACRPATLEVFNVSSNQTEQGPYVIPTEYGEQCAQPELLLYLPTDCSFLLPAICK